MVAGLILLPRFLKLFKDRRSSQVLFVAGACISGLAVLLDSIDFKSYSLTTQRAQQFIEELLETGGMLLFLNALLLSLFQQIRKKS